MAEPSAQEGLTLLQTSLGDFALAEGLSYPNGGSSRFYTHGSTAIVIDYDICRISQGQQAFDYSLITSKQNEYVAKYNRVYRFLGEDADDLERFLAADDRGQDERVQERRTVDRADLAEATPLEARL